MKLLNSLILNDDIYAAVKKAENEVAVVSPESTVLKMNKTGEKFAPSQRGDVLPGTILSSRVGNGFENTQALLVVILSKGE